MLQTLRRRLPFHFVQLSSVQENNVLILFVTIVDEVRSTVADIQPQLVSVSITSYMQSRCCAVAESAVLR